MSKLADHFKAQRLRRGLSLMQLAEKIGSDNVRKTAGKIGRFEGGGKVSEELLARLADALEIEATTLEELMEG
jgi:transcriptional regulator with XRE-family HTH domain